MQILPTLTQAFDSFLNINAPRAEDTPGDIFSHVLNTVKDTDAEMPLPESAAFSRKLMPYSRTTHNGITYTLDEVGFTKEEVQQLRQDLTRAGATEESLQRLDALAEKPDGATLAQVTESLREDTSPPLLTEEEKSEISSLLKKIDPTGTLEEHVQSLLSQGKGQDALGAILHFLGQLDPADRLEITRSEALALGKGLGLGATHLQALAACFGPHDVLHCPHGQFSAVLPPLTEFFASRKATQKMLDAALRETLQPMIAKARARTEKENQANSLHDRESQLSQILIARTVQKNTKETLEQTLGAAQEAVNQKGDVQVRDAAERRSGQDSVKSHAQNAVADNTARRDRSMSASSEDHRQVAAAPRGATGTARSEAAFGTENHRESAAGDILLADREQKNFRHETRQEGKSLSAWGEMLHKVEARVPAAGNADSGMIHAAAQQQAPADIRASVTIPRQAAQQVQQGIFSLMKGGGSRLDLQLHPQELGTLAITLTVRNGEVSAAIRSDKTETAEIVARQLDMIRTNLEQQGLKVDKVEVHVNTGRQDDQAWQNLEQHNTWQEESARREELARLRNLATGRDSSQKDNHDELEQPVQSTDHAAQYASRSLHLVA
ncbi:MULTISPECIES: flagellar hook-length control protein FliK [unclassified Desulfovibrio]|uniref:flagellar hook-length control protein FliK n=1 Tax=unclassified Desulfovibrio TaxID=2593640 RepID=UPI000F5F4B14|nr:MULTISPECIES: flagellar hook-length control protein FliK [unclassified Desulfovibrio]RRD71570.1 flagellar hook-length control protein FliK [Desulfovibrio sp. OH1209_COT-279]RRD87815.1 flagellar hook-length control protein FliK [Desulfovibrio sp. OH1186_COT-070]